MGHTYTPNPSAGVASGYTLPDDGVDKRQVSSVNVPFEALADGLASVSIQQPSLTFQEYTAPVVVSSLTFVNVRTLTMPFGVGINDQLIIDASMVVSNVVDPGARLLVRLVVSDPASGVVVKNYTQWATQDGSETDPFDTFHAHAVHVADGSGALSISIQAEIASTGAASIGDSLIRVILIKAVP